MRIQWMALLLAARAAAADSEIDLALEAAPPAVTKGAGVYVHGKDGYSKARDSTNGFVCLVDHSIPNAVEPQCMDAEGVKTFLPKYELVASLRARGTPEPTIRKAVKEAFAKGKLRAPRRPGIIYMLSPHNIVAIDEEKGVAAPVGPHLMFYAPNLTAADVGSDGTPSSVVFVADEKTPHALIIVPVGARGHAR